MGGASGQDGAAGERVQRRPRDGVGPQEGAQLPTTHGISTPTSTNFYLVPLQHRLPFSVQQPSQLNLVGPVHTNIFPALPFFQSRSSHPHPFPLCLCPLDFEAVWRFHGPAVVLRLRPVPGLFALRPLAVPRGHGGRSGAQVLV